MRNLGVVASLLLALSPMTAVASDHLAGDWQGLSETSPFRCDKGMVFFFEDDSMRLRKGGIVEKDVALPYSRSGNLLTLRDAHGNVASFRLEGDTLLLVESDGANSWKSLGAGFGRCAAGRANADLDDCVGFPAHLRDCAPHTCGFFHPVTGNTAQRRVFGRVGDACKTSEDGYLPQRTLVCDWPVGQLPRAAAYYEALRTAKSVHSRTEILDSGEKATRTFIDGKEIDDPVNQALNGDVCRIEASPAAAAGQGG